MKNLGINKKTLALLLAVVLTVGCAVGGTIAWLLATTEEVVNTFTVGNIDIELAEAPVTDGKFTDGTGANLVEGQDNEYAMVPGNVYDKNPTVTVKANSVDCYLFVEYIATNNTMIVEGEEVQIIIHGTTFNDDTAWKQLSSAENVWYREVMTSEADMDWELLDDNSITVNENVSKEMMDAYTNNTAEEPKISFNAYAVQMYRTNPKTENTKFTADEAWELLKP